MAYSDHLEEFHEAAVVEFDDAGDWQGPQVAYRLREDFEDEGKIEQRLSALLEQPQSAQLRALIIGAWSGSFEGANSAQMVAALVKAAPRLPELRHLFFGEMVCEECEISWIKLSDMSPLLNAFPKLESLRVRGGEGLAFSKTKHDNLRELAVESGGLARAAIRDIFLCQFPALEHLELLLGEANYGFDGGAEDLQPLLSGQLFPKLKWLGLMNSEIANDIAAVAVNAPLVSRLETLDLSLGNLDGEGVQSFAGLAAFPNLRTLNITHHFATDAEIAALKKALKCQVIAQERQEPEEDWRPIVHAE
jgi:hypothetical protein